MGPAIVATPATAPQTPKAAPRRSAGKVLVMMVSVCGMSMAAPSPCTARNPMSHPGLGAAPQAADATVKTATPEANMIRGPIRSPSRPAVMTRTASTRAYALITQSTSSSEACSLTIMFGIAMLTIVRSSRVMKNPSETTSSTAHGFPRNFATDSLLSPKSPVRRTAVPPGRATCCRCLLMVDRGADNSPRLRDPPWPRLRIRTRFGWRGGGRSMLPAMKLNGTAAIISGGASGLGAAVARRLAAAGVTAVVADLNEEQGKTVAAETGGVFVKTDVADENSVTAAVETAAAQGAPLRIVVSCAGIGWAARTVGRDGTPHDLAAYRKVIDINLIGTFNLMRIGAAAIARTEPADADNQRGVVINTSSVAGLEGQTGQIAYSASKGGIIGMTVPAARDLAAVGIRVNTICPGIIDTPIYGFAPDAEQFKAKLAAPVVFPKRMGTSAEFAHLVQTLIENDYMNAEVLRLDGGIRFQPK